MNTCRLLLAIAWLCLGSKAAFGDYHFSANSIYNVSMEWIDEEGTLVSLSNWVGKPVVVTLIYTLGNTTYEIRP